MNENKANIFGRKFLVYSNVIIICLSVIVIIGWIFNISILKSLHFNSVFVKIFETFALVFASITLMFYHNHKDSTLMQVFKASLMWFVFLVGAVSFTNHLFSFGGDIDKWFFQDLIKYTNHNYITMLSPTTSMGFIFLSVSLYLLNIKKRIWISHTLLSIIFFISLFALVGYFIKIEHFCFPS